jgi:hypothetical protein
MGTEGVRLAVNTCIAAVFWAIYVDDIDGIIKSERTN